MSKLFYFYKIVFLLFFIAMTIFLSCQSQNQVLELPYLELSNIKHSTISFPDNSFLTWKETIQLAHQHWQPADISLQHSIIQLQTLLSTRIPINAEVESADDLKNEIELDKNSPFHFHTPIDEEITKSSIPVLSAIKSSQFQGWELPQTQIPEFQKSWYQLEQAEQDFLHAGVIIAELRQKWQNVEPHASYTELVSALNELPSQSWLEYRKKLCHNIAMAYQQLMIQNTSLHPPQF